MIKQILFLFIFLEFFVVKAQPEFPSQKGYINDFEMVLSKFEEQKLDSLVKAFEKRTSIEIVVVSLDSNYTNKADFDDYTLKLANHWRVGKKDKNNGILIGFSKSLRKMRIQNGYGIERLMSDEETKKIVDSVFIPLYKVGRFYEGTSEGISAIQQFLDKVTSMPYKHLTVDSDFYDVRNNWPIASIDTLRLKVKANVFQDSIVLNYPLVKTGKTAVDSLINLNILSQLTGEKNHELSTESRLKLWANEFVADLNFNVSYNNNNLLSVQLKGEWCSAYCTIWDLYFNFDLNTGLPLLLNDVLDTSQFFKKQVKKRKDEQLRKQKAELFELKNDPDAELDSSTFEWALVYYKDCEERFNFQDFILHPYEIEIIQKCGMPHVIQNLTPFFDLRFPYNDIKQYLKIPL